MSLALVFRVFFIPAKAEVNYEDKLLTIPVEDILSEDFYYSDERKQNEVLYTYIGQEQDLGDYKEIGTNYVKYENSMKIYPGDVFYNPISENKTYSIEYATTTSELYLDIVAPTQVGLIGKYFNFVAFADTIYADYDGEARNYTPHDADFTDFTNATADEVDYSSITTKWYLQSNANTFYDYRKAVLKFDLSSLTDTVATATINLYDSNFKGDGVGMGEYSDSAFTTSNDGFDQISTADYNNCTRNLASDYIAIGSLGTSQYNTWTLNEFGLSQVNASSSLNVCFIPKADIEQYDITPTSGDTYSYVFFNTIEQTGTANDPYLEIEYAADEEEEPAATSTPYDGITGMEYSDDLSIITSYKEHYETSSITPDWIEYEYYHIPFFVYLVIAIPTIWIASRLILELIIRLRK